MSSRSLHAAPALASLLLLASCMDAGPVDSGGDEGRLRVFNAVVNQNTTRPGDTVDVLVDGSDAAPGARALPRGTATAYAPVRAGVHSFQARIAGDTRPATLSNLVVFDARVRTLGEWDHTVYMVGRVPAFGAPDVQPLLVREDPFPPSMGPDGVRNARIRMVNAAPFAGGATPTGTQLRLVLTDADAPSPPLSTLQPAGVASYRNATADVEVPPGRFRATVVRGTALVLVQDTVHLAPGSVRTLVVVSRAAAATPSAANHTLVKLQDPETPR